ncbi:MAG: hypothetical protein Tsb0020_44110 [Haliangiales bacterium]
MNSQPTIHPQPAAVTTSTDTRYKFVELSIVTDESLESTVNQWVARGWQFNGIYFVTSESSRRPAMAFVTFVRQASDAHAERPGASSALSPANSELSPTESDLADPSPAQAPRDLARSDQGVVTATPDHDSEPDPDTLTRSSDTLTRSSGSDNAAGDKPTATAAPSPAPNSTPHSHNATAAPEEINDDEPTNIFYE